MGSKQEFDQLLERVTKLENFVAQLAQWTHFVETSSSCACAKDDFNIIRKGQPPKVNVTDVEPVVSFVCPNFEDEDNSPETKDINIIALPGSTGSGDHLDIEIGRVEIYKVKVEHSEEGSGVDCDLGDEIVVGELFAGIFPENHDRHLFKKEENVDDSTDNEQDPDFIPSSSEEDSGDINEDNEENSKTMNINSSSDGEMLSLESEDSPPHVRCPKCRKKFKSRSNMRSHNRCVHLGLKRHCPKTVPCPECEKMFPKKSEMEKHLKAIHQRIRYACSKCPRTYAYEKDARRHEIALHGLSD